MKVLREEINVCINVKKHIFSQSETTFIDVYCKLSHYYLIITLFTHKSSLDYIKHMKHVKPDSFFFFFAIVK